jgi:class 3 adenylate cyclase
VLADQQRLLREVFAAHGDEEVDTQGDSFLVAFRSAQRPQRRGRGAEGDRCSRPDGSDLRVQ